MRRPVLLCALALVAGCTTTAPDAAAPAPPPATTSAAAEPMSAPSTSDAPEPTPARTPEPTPDPTPARRRVVVLDPGHNGGNATHYAQISRLVDAGNGRRKPCNEVGTETDAGYPEHAFTWDVVNRVRPLLARRGIDVRLTRPSDTGVGPCVDVRGRSGNAVRADVVLSVHADGAPPGGSGFHVIEAPRAPAATQRLARTVRATLRSSSGLRYADYIAGGDGLDVRDDLAGLNLSTRPTVMVELGNMRNAGDAALQTSATGRQRIAAALATAIVTYLG